MNDDLISRQAVLDAIEELKKIHFDRVVVLNKVSDRVSDLPPVNPQEPKSILEDIKAEINEAIESYKNKDKAVMYGFMCALYIIDKRIEGWG